MADTLTIKKRRFSRWHVTGPGVFSCYHSENKAAATECARILNQGRFLELPDGRDKADLLTLAKTEAHRLNQSPNESHQPSNPDA